jgi:hypothetical protein
VKLREGRRAVEMREGRKEVETKARGEKWD